MAAIRCSKTFDQLYDYTRATDVKVTPPPARSETSTPISYMTRRKCRKGGSAWEVICEKHADNIDLITTLKGNLEPTCDKTDQCPTSNYTSGYIITNPPSQQSDTSIKSYSAPHIRAIHAKQIYHIG